MSCRTPSLTISCANPPSDDTWNQTAADNAEWLLRFKRDVGIIKDFGRGLPDGPSWAIEQGGSGFAPPYAYPQGQVKSFTEDMQIPMREGAKAVLAGQAAANSYVESLSSVSFRPATVFCSRELEQALVALVFKHVEETGRMPTDAALQARACEALKTDHTSAEDPALLEKFKEWMRQQLPHAMPAVEKQGLSALPANMDVNLSDAELGNILQDMDFEFDVQGFHGGEEDGGVSLMGAGSFKS